MAREEVLTVKVEGKIDPSLKRGYSSQAGAGWVERIAEQAFARHSRNLISVLKVV